MTFDEWWKQMKPAECDELKPYFEEAWEISATTERVEIENCHAKYRELFSAAQNLCKVKGRHHSEIAMRRLMEVCGVEPLLAKVRLSARLEDWLLQRKVKTWMH